MNTVNGHYGVTAQALELKKSATNQANHLNRNSLKSTSVEDVSHTSARSKNTKQHIQNHNDSDNRATLDMPLEEKLALLSSIDKSKVNKESLISEPQLMKNETAVANYRLIGNMAKRESVQNMLGIDLFA